MFDKINALFTACTIEDDRDVLVMQTIARLIEKRRKEWGAVEAPAITEYCLGISIDQLQAALPLTMPAENVTQPAVTIAQTVQSINRLTSLYNYLCNNDEFEVIHLSKQFMHELQKANRQEAQEQNLQQFFGLMQSFRPAGIQPSAS